MATPEGPSLDLFDSNENLFDNGTMAIIGPYAFTLYYLLKHQADEKGWCKLMINEISEITEISKPAIRKAIDRLVETSLIRKEKSQRANRYFIEQFMPAARDEASQIFDKWKDILKHPSAVLDTKRKNRIMAALKNYTRDQLEKAILGCSKSPHNMGDNDRNTKYDSIALIFRDPETIERFISYDDNPPKRRQKPFNKATERRPRKPLT